ncbi:MAG: 30S ribosomal protein S18 [Deltaproteobacteria bacterium]|nr:30S ribosomal protein S18 [Deltaproteobacteria bacterium]
MRTDRKSGNRRSSNVSRFRRPSVAKDYQFDYKNPQTLKRFITERGKIIPRRITRITAQQQRQLTQAVKRARQLAFLPYTSLHSLERE